MRRGTSLFAVLLAVAVSMFGAATSAWAHEEIRPNTFRTQTPTFFTISAADEQKVELVTLVLTAGLVTRRVSPVLVGSVCCSTGVARPARLGRRG
jgi:hypothetical protein